MSHDHHHHHSHDFLANESGNLPRSLRVIARLNRYAGNTQFITGLLLQSATVTMGGIHDRVDHNLYEIKADAAETDDPEVERKLRRKAARRMLGFAGVIFTGETVHYSIDPNHTPGQLSIAVAAGAFLLNVVSASLLMPHRSNPRAKDGIRHALKTDVPSSAVTLVATALAQKIPAFDILGAGFHTAVSAGMAGKILSETNDHVHPEQ